MIHIVTAVNEKYRRYLQVMLTSLFENGKNDEICVYVLQRDLSGREEEGLIKFAENYDQKLECIHVDESIFANLPTTEKFSLETYFRLAMAEYIPQAVERILYIDVDIIVQHSLAELYGMDLKGKTFAACQDHGLPLLDAYRKKLYGHREDERYFNAGVMVWDMEKVRRKYSYKVFEKAANELGGVLPYADQEILNYILYDDVRYIDGIRYNYVADRFEREEFASCVDDALIIHYAACNPWQVGAKNGLYKRWWHFAKKTPFYLELLEEQLERVESSNSAFAERRNWEMVQIFQAFYELKGTGRLKDALSRYQSYAIYGAGYLAECFWKFLTEEKCAYPAVVIDKNKAGVKFHGISVFADVVQTEEMMIELLIITPAGIADEICRDINLRQENIRVMSLKDFLRSID